VANSVFQNNLAHEDGGAIYNDSTDVIIAHNTFRDNDCNYYGGAAYFTGNNGSLGTHIVNSIFWENNSEHIPCAKEISSSIQRDINPTYCDIDNDDLVIIRPYFDTGRITAILHRIRTWCRYRSDTSREKVWF